MAWLDHKDVGLDITGPLSVEDREGLFPKSLQTLLISLHRHFEVWRRELLQARQVRQKLYDAGHLPEYLKNHPATQLEWQVAKIPHDLLDRRVEITGPVNSAKMVINMLNPNSDGVAAEMAMLDFEDSMKPTWTNVISGYKNVIGAVDGSLTYMQPGDSNAKDKVYKLNEGLQAHVMIRVRGLHLDENNILVDGEPMPAGLVDLAVTAYHTAQLFIKKGQTPKYYVPKTESFVEARWWNFVFRKIEDGLGLQRGTLRCTFLIETLPAAFQMEEILYEIRERACGLNGGRWDKIFSDIKTLRMHPDRIMANRSFIDMTKPWMENYAKRLIKICHKHGAFGMGGMSAFTPGKEAETRKVQTEKVRADKAREASIGHDGCWVSHPYFITIAKEQFKDINQLNRKLEDFSLQPDLLPQSVGPKTIDGLRTNIRVGIAYQQGWNQGLGCVAFENLMEDLATLEISRAQTWQWLHHKVKLDDGTVVTPALVTRLFDQECEHIIKSLADEGYDAETIKTLAASFKTAAAQVKDLFLQPDLVDFYTLIDQNKTKPTGGRYGLEREGTRATLGV